MYCFIIRNQKIHYSWPLKTAMRALFCWHENRFIVCKFGRNRAIWLREKAILARAQKCPYHVTFDLDLETEHILDARWPGDHRVQVWSQSGHFSGRRSVFRASTKVSVSRNVWPWPWPWPWLWAHPRCALTRRPSCASLVAIRPFACEKKRLSWSAQKRSYHVTFDLDLDLEHNLDARPPTDHPVQVW